MAQLVYVEREALSHPRTQSILSRYPHKVVQVIERYAEVFNAKKQNFRAQKAAPSLILALKPNALVHATPPQYETGGGAHYYFSHMLNCVYDCRYCFLQGMFRSAHYLVFVNYEDFDEQIGQLAQQHASNERPTWFFSGYDCDSLAFEPVTQFADFFLDRVNNWPNAVLELRTKSTQVRSLLKRSASEQVVIAASLSPEPIVASIEKGVPSLQKRLDALLLLQQAGWRIGVRFDPVIWNSDYQAQYSSLIRDTFTRLDPQRIDSVTIGGFRLPKDFHHQMRKLYPDHPLFLFGLTQHEGMVRYSREIEQSALKFVQDQCSDYIEQSRLFTYFSDSPVEHMEGISAL